jgi:hypothetical protein
VRKSVYKKNLSDYSDESSRLRRIKRIRNLAYLLDNSIRIPGTKYRIGLDPIIGLIPGVGDTIGAILSVYIVSESARLGVPKRTLLHMIYNIGVEALVGAIPIAGDIFDAAWKANAKNAALLDEYLNKHL